MLVQGWSWRDGAPGRRSRSGERSRPGRQGWPEHLRSRRAIAQRGMRAHAVVRPSPALDDDLRLPKGVEDLAIQQLVPKPGIKAFHVPILPRRAPLDVRRLGPNRTNP